MEVRMIYMTAYIIDMPYIAGQYNFFVGLKDRGTNFV